MQEKKIKPMYLNACNSRSIFLAIFLILTLFSSCKKELANSTIIVNESKDGILPYPLDWETANFMPTPPGTSILVPWGSGSNQTFSPDLALDYKATDGWVLVYNTFNTTALSNPKQFMLYNKYRGLLRLYLYLDPNTPNPSSNITHSLSLSSTGGATSSILNFAGKDVIDISAPNTTTVSEIQQYQIIATGSWYVFQFEMAYDPTISNFSYQNLNLLWSAGSTNITEANLAGSINGSLKGTIGTPAGPPSIINALGKGVVTITGLAVLSNNPTLLPSLIQSKVQGALQDGLNGSIHDLFNGIFGGNSNNAQEVNLHFNADLKITGTLINSSGLLYNVFAIPGTANSQNAPSFSPGYTQPLGVFNISNRPQVKVTSVRTTPPPNWDGLPTRYYVNSFSLQPASFSTIINPALSGIATVQVLYQTVFLPESVVDPTNHFYSYNAYKEQIGQSVYYEGTPMDGTQINAGPGLAVVRMVLKVTPVNGAPPSTIVKTFLADLVL